MTHPVHILRDNVGITEVLGRCRLGHFCKLEHSTKTEAVGAVRYRVFELGNYCCRYCGVLVTWESGHMHEALKRRGQGGHYSITNSVVACPACHDDQHPEKKLQSSKKVKT